MYVFLKGIVDRITESTVELDVHGVGYEVGISTGTAAAMPPVGSSVKIYTYTYMREDQMALYGFMRRDELDLFKQLITVSGIGPKAGLSLLSAMSADDLRFAIIAGDVKTISKAPGIGKRTAERLILELKGKVDNTAALAEMIGSTSGDGAAATAENVSGDLQDAIEALTALGYNRTEAMRAVKQAASEGVSGTEALLRAALKKMH